MKALLLENIHPLAVESLERNGFEVELRSASMSEDELVAALPGVSLLGIRSNTKVTDAVLEAATDLIAIGCFCIGTNQVDLAAAAARGIAVFNAPYSNTRSVVELVIGEIIALARRLPEKTAQDARRGLGQVGRRAATRSAGARSASSATATSAPSSPTSPRPSVCASSSSTPPTASPTATPAGCPPSTTCWPRPTS